MPAAAVTAALLLAACAEQVPYACPPLAEGVEVVANEGPGAWAEEGLSARVDDELWRRGGTREDEEIALPTFPGASSTGRLALPDFRLGEAIVIEPDGTWAGPWVRSGQGPEEIRSAVAATWTPDGQLLVLDVVGAKVVRLEGESSVVEVISVDPSFTSPLVARGELMWAGLLPDGDALLARIEPTETEEWETAAAASILRLETGAEVPDTVAAVRSPAVTVDQVRGWPVPGWPRPLAATNTRGELVVGATDGSYRLLVRDSTGEAILQLCRDADPLPLTAAERGEALPAFVGDAGSEEVPEIYENLRAAIREAEHPETAAPFGRLVLGAGGRIWVQRERPPAYPGSRALMHGRTGAVHDVFDPDGTYLGEVRMPEGEALQAVLGDTIWTFGVGELNETWVRARELRLEPAGPEDREGGG
ncbi:MAG: hypothetical protein ACOC83_09245, partial [Gemmatimonadota bacterium]